MKEQTIIILTVIVLAVGFYALDTWRHPVQAAGNLETCQAFAVAGNIVLYECEAPNGMPVYVNSIGFMALEP